MPPIEVGPAQAINAISARLARAAGGQSASGTEGAASKSQAQTASVSARSSSSPVKTSDALDPGAAPVDFERVQVIRKAVETGNYPVIPTKIADAMIAAGVLLRSAKQ